MRALVVDDELRARQRLARLLAAMPGVEVVGEAPHGRAALEAIPRVQPDAVFLDVQMPGLSGFEVLDTLPEARRPLVVFVTAHDEYALRAFDVSAVDFLVKPVTPDRLARALVRLRDRDAQQRLTDLVTHLRQARPLERIVGKQRHEFHVIPVEVVEAFVAERELVFAITSRGRFLVDKTLRELEAALDVRRLRASIGARLSTWQDSPCLSPSFEAARQRDCKVGTRLRSAGGMGSGCVTSWDGDGDRRASGLAILGDEFDGRSLQVADDGVTPMACTKRPLVNAHIGIGWARGQ